MLGAGHRAVGASWGLAFGMVLDLPPWQTVASAGIASVFAAGRVFSPDMDQAWWWRILDDLLPDELLDRRRIPGWSPGKGGPLQHRGISHSPLIPLLATAALVIWWPEVWWWVIAAAITGWASHLFADTLFGMGHAESGRRGGIPWILWYGHWGLEWDVGGAWEKAFTRVVMPVVITVQGLFLVGLGPRVVDAAARTIAGG